MTVMIPPSSLIGREEGLSEFNSRVLPSDAPARIPTLLARNRLRDIDRLRGDCMADIPDVNVAQAAVKEIFQEIQGDSSDLEPLIGVPVEVRIRYFNGERRAEDVTPYLCHLR